MVYVDVDPVAVAHSREILAGNDRRRGRPGGPAATRSAILAHPDVRRLLDLSQPVAVMVVAVLHFVSDDDRPAELLRTLRDALAPGSYLVLSQASDDGRSDDERGRGRAGLPAHRQSALGAQPGRADRALRRVRAGRPGRGLGARSGDRTPRRARRTPSARSSWAASGDSVTELPDGGRTHPGTLRPRLGQGGLRHQLPADDPGPAGGPAAPAHRAAGRRVARRAVRPARRAPGRRRAGRRAHRLRRGPRPYRRGHPAPAGARPRSGRPRTSRTGWRRLLARRGDRLRPCAAGPDARRAGVDPPGRDDGPRRRPSGRCGPARPGSATRPPTTRSPACPTARCSPSGSPPRSTSRAGARSGSGCASSTWTGFKVVNDTLGHQRRRPAAGRRGRAAAPGASASTWWPGWAATSSSSWSSAPAAPTTWSRSPRRPWRRSRTPALVDGHELAVTASIGIVERPVAGADPERADAGRRQHAALGEGRRRGPLGAVRPDAQRTANWPGTRCPPPIPAALDRGEFYLDYQPLTSLRDGTAGRRGGAGPLAAPASWACCGRTASSRLAEETGLIVQLGGGCWPRRAARRRRWSAGGAAGAVRQRQPGRAAGAPARAWCRRSARCCGRPACRRSGSSWRSPRAR